MALNIFIHEYQGGATNLHAVHQRLLGQVVVDQGRRTANGPEPKPGKEEFGRVVQVKCYQVTGLYSFGQEEGGKLADATVQFTKSEAAISRPYRRMIGVLGRSLVEEVKGRPLLLFI